MCQPVNLCSSVSFKTVHRSCQCLELEFRVNIDWGCGGVCFHGRKPHYSRSSLLGSAALHRSSHLPLSVKLHSSQFCFMCRLLAVFHYTHTHTHTCRLSLSHAHTHTHTHTQARSLSLPFTLSLSLSHTHTHLFSLSHAHTLTHGYVYITTTRPIGFDHLIWTKMRDEVCLLPIVMMSLHPRVLFNVDWMLIAVAVFLVNTVQVCVYYIYIFCSVHCLWMFCCMQCDCFVKN